MFKATTTVTTARTGLTARSFSAHRTHGAPASEEVHPVEYLKLALQEANMQVMDDDASFVNLCDNNIEKDDSHYYGMDLATAVRSCDLDKIRDFHAKGASLDVSNRFGESLIHMACRRGDARVVRFMVQEAGVNLYVKDDLGRTPLHDAVWTPEPNVEVMDILLDNLSDPGRLLLTKDQRGHTAFDYARREHWSKWVSYMEERKHHLTGAGRSSGILSSKEELSATAAPIQMIG